MNHNQSELINRVANVMAQKGMLGRPLDPAEVAEICRAISTEDADDKKSACFNTKAHVVRVGVVPDDPDYESAKAALLTVTQPLILASSLRKVAPCHFYFETGGRVPELTITRKKRPFYLAQKPSACKLQMIVRLPESWRTSPEQSMRLNWLAVAPSRKT